MAERNRTRRNKSVENQINTMCDKIDSMIEQKTRAFDLNGSPDIRIKDDDYRLAIRARARQTEERLRMFNDAIVQHTKYHLTPEQKATQAFIRGDYDV